MFWADLLFFVVQGEVIQETDGRTMRLCSSPRVLSGVRPHPRCRLRPRRGWLTKRWRCPDGKTLQEEGLGVGIRLHVGCHSQRNIRETCPPCNESEERIRKWQCEADSWTQRGTRPRPRRRTTRWSIGLHHEVRWLWSAGTLFWEHGLRRRPWRGVRFAGCRGSVSRPRLL